MKNEKTKTKTKTNMLAILIALLALGFIGVGATALSVADDRTHADNQSQAATPWNVTPSGTSPWTLTQGDLKVNSSNRRRRNRKANEALWKIAKNNGSADIPDWDFKMSASKKNRNPGTPEQKAAWKRFGLKTPFRRANEIVEMLYFNVVVQGGINGSVQSVLNEEFELILKRETQRLTDPTYKVDYLLQVCMNLGVAMIKVAKKEATKELSKTDILEFLTITPTHLKHAFESNKALADINGYELVIRPYKVGKKNGVTPELHAKYYRGNSPLKKAIIAQVEETFDEEIWNPLKAEHEPSPEDSKQYADGKVQMLINDFDCMTTPEFQDLLPDIHSLIMQIYNKVSVFKALKEAGTLSTEAKKKHNKEVKSLYDEFHTTYVNLKNADMPTREEALKEAVNKAYKKAEKVSLKTNYSVEILMARKESGKTVATLQYHLSHMSEYKPKGSTFAKNDHKGARFLLGPSNGVMIPDAIHKGYKNAIADTSAGNSGRLSGDIVSLQMIQKSSMKGKYFTVVKDMKNKPVEKIMDRRFNNRHLYTMINIALGKDPEQRPHLVLGLYTDPALVESGGTMTAPVLVKDLKRTAIKNNLPDLIRTEVPQRKGRRKAPGPNTRKHRKSNNQNRSQEYNPADLDMDIDPETGKPYIHEEYVKEHMDKQAEADAAEAALKAQEKAELEAEVAEMRKQHFKSARTKKTVTQLKKLLRARDLPVSGKKDDLIDRLLDDGYTFDE